MNFKSFSDSETKLSSCTVELTKIKGRNVLLEKNVTAQAAYDFSKCKNIGETTLSVVTRLQKCEKDLKNCSMVGDSNLVELNSYVAENISQQLLLGELRSEVATLSTSESDLKEEVSRLTLALEAEVRKSNGLVQEHASQLARLQSTVDTLQDDFSAVGICHNGSQDSNCSHLLEPYVCIPKVLKPKLCSTGSQDERLGLFGLRQCQLLGDETIGFIDVLSFVSSNPWTSSFLLTILVLAVVGILTPLWVYCHTRRRNVQLVPDHSSLTNTDPAANSGIIEAGLMPELGALSSSRRLRRGWTPRMPRKSRPDIGVRLRTFRELYDNMGVNPRTDTSAGKFVVIFQNILFRIL